MKKVLIADDQETVLFLLEEFFKKLGGYEVFSVKSGKDGLEILQRNEKFSLIISDVRMPGIDGHEMIKGLNGEAPPTIFMSGNSDNFKPVKEFFPDAICLVKPFGIDELRGIIEKIS